MKSPTNDTGAHTSRVCITADVGSKEQKQTQPSGPRSAEIVSFGQLPKQGLLVAASDI